MIEGPVFFEPATRADRLTSAELEMLAAELGELVKARLREKYGAVSRVAPVVIVSCGTLNAIESSELNPGTLADLLLLNAYGIHLKVSRVTGGADESRH